MTSSRPRNWCGTLVIWVTGRGCWLKPSRFFGRVVEPSHVGDETKKHPCYNSCNHLVILGWCISNFYVTFWKTFQKSFRFLFLSGLILSVCDFFAFHLRVVNRYPFFSPSTCSSAVGQICSDCGNLEWKVKEIWRTSTEHAVENPVLRILKSCLLPWTQWYEMNLF